MICLVATAFTGVPKLFFLCEGSERSVRMWEFHPFRRLFLCFYLTIRAPTIAHALLNTYVDQHALCHYIDDLDEKLGGVEAPPPRRPLLRQLAYGLPPVLTILCSLAYAATGSPPPRRSARLSLRHSRGGRVLDTTAPRLSQNS